MIEVIVTNTKELEDATKGGATRIELVSAMHEDGLTPSATVLLEACIYASIPIRTMVRFHNNGFVYTEAEIEEICLWISKHKHLPIDGFVVGALTKNNCIDTAFLDKVTKNCGNKPLTFHRAFDNLTEEQQFKALDILKNYPIDTILTSGGRVKPINQNLEHLSQLASHAPTIKILLGGGVNTELVTQLQGFPNLNAIHIGSAAHYDNDFSKPINPANIANLYSLLNKK
ncbi:MAG: copper homeostasis protein CutC [Treponemataceae bacterium]